MYILYAGIGCKSPAKQTVASFHLVKKRKKRSLNREKANKNFNGKAIRLVSEQVKCKLFCIWGNLGAAPVHIVIVAKSS